MTHSIFKEVEMDSYVHNHQIRNKTELLNLRILARDFNFISNALELCTRERVTNWRSIDFFGGGDYFFIHLWYYEGNLLICF